MTIKIPAFRSCALLLALLGAAFGAHAGVSSEVQHALRDGTFEVVMKKPEHEAVVYEKPLPLELLPYIERTDAYRSIGTAFALGNNRYVTAAHVIAQGIGSQFGPPALRRSDGTVFEIDRVLEYSEHEDFVVFSLQKDPAPSPLTVNREPKLDQPVVAVGNALGEGIVIRDGLFTSETPEAQDGRWKWIRFSAAASPGNSGGPLCDVDGKVIGVVVLKSPNENLNYALPIARVLDAQEQKARFDQKTLVALPYLHGTTTYAYTDEFKLPLPWTAFVKAHQALIEHHVDASFALLLKTYASSLFPRGPGSDDLLYAAPPGNARPRLIYQAPDGIWAAPMPDFHEVSLPGDGSVAVANAANVRLLRLIRPSSASDDAFYADSKGFMDLALKAVDLHRSVGNDNVRVLSLGAAISDTLYTDGYGRKWQQRVWPVPFLDAYIVGQLLPTPDGYDALLLWAPSITLHSMVEVTRLMAGQIDVSYDGTVSQWQAALRRRALLPDALASVKLDTPAPWTLQTKHFTSSVPTEVLTLSDKSLLTLVMGFTSAGGRADWDVQGAWWYQSDRRDAAVGVWRRARPPSDAKLELRNDFDGVRERRAPYDGSLSRETPETLSATRVLDVPGSAPGTVSSDLAYGLTLQLLGYPSLLEVEKSLTQLAAATRLSERGVGEDVAPRAALSPLDQQFSALEGEMLAKVAEVTALVGKDLRGRTISDDVHDLLEQMKTQLASLHAGGDAQAAEELYMSETQRFSWLESYWRAYPHLRRSQEMWTEFLSRNHLSASTPHAPNIGQAEQALRGALARPPSQEWVSRARELQEAYVGERRELVKSHVPSKTQLPPLSARHTPCPPASKTTSGGQQPRFARSAHQLEDMYPVESRKLGEEGTVMAAVQISDTGCVTAMAIVGSSGSSLLDGAVLDWLESVEFIPGEADGRATGSTQILPVAFKLENE